MSARLVVPGGIATASFRELVSPAFLTIPMLILGLGLGAQQPAAVREPHGPSAMTGSFSFMGAHYAHWLVQAFDSIPAARYGYAPTPTQQTVGYIAQHLADANYSLCARFSGLKRSMNARDSLADTLRARWPKDTLVARLKASFAFCSAAVSRVDDAKLPEDMPIGAPGSGRTQQRTLSLLLFVTDLAEHYSQISSYMRLIDMVPPSALPAVQRTAITAPAATLPRYVGVYEIAPGTMLDPALVLEITLGDGRLSVKPKGQPGARLWPESDSVFFLKEVDAEITFTRNPAGAVTGLVLHQNGEHRVGKRVK
jgi:uncharacterized damage-inducible protein DinB